MFRNGSPKQNGFFRIGQAIFGLELFEWVGLFASLGALFIFFVDGHKLDNLVHHPGYHWHVVWLISGIYVRFIPYAIGVGLLIFLSAGHLFRTRWRESLERFRYALRIFLSYCVLLIVFRIVNFYVPVLSQPLYDSHLQAMDKAIFGNQVSYLLQPLAHRWLTYLLSGVYISWFWLLFATIAVLLSVSRKKEAVAQYVFATLLAFYLGYLCYVFIPVIGPGYTMHYQTTLGGEAPVFTTSRLLISRDCFPSLHTATSVLMVIYIYRYARRWLWFYIPMALLIIFATLYLRIHYGIDDICGTCLAIVVSHFSPVVCEWWESARVKVEKSRYIRHTKEGRTL